MDLIVHAHFRDDFEI